MLEIVPPVVIRQILMFSSETIVLYPKLCRERRFIHVVISGFEMVIEVV